MTPFKQLYVFVDESKFSEAEEELAKAGLRVLPTGSTTKNLQACNFCKGHEEAGLSFALRLDEAISGMEVPVPIKIGYAGCALGTSEPLTKDISVVKMRDVYDLYVGGDVKGIKAKLAKLFMSGIREERVIPIILEIIDYYRTHAKGKEKFTKYIDRINLKEVING
ncbi:nitrite reductase [Cohnella herbarum]|uniref:Nitrite reductase n=2 Tax=Cohnella herbarum TaxID=2728023 RepID=A0A7Z2ZQC7_9BACL|nr:nitrite reductase [Cohnella herbarum]